MVTPNGPLPFVDMDGVGRRLAFAPIMVKVCDAGKLAQAVFVDPFAAGGSARFLLDGGVWRP